MTHDDKFHKMQRQRVVDNFLPEDEFFAMQEAICGDQCSLVSESRKGNARGKDDRPRITEERDI